MSYCEFKNYKMSNLSISIFIVTFSLLIYLIFLISGFISKDKNFKAQKLNEKDQ